MGQRVLAGVQLLGGQQRFGEGAGADDLGVGVLGACIEKGDDVGIGQSALGRRGRPRARGPSGRGRR